MKRIRIGNDIRFRMVLQSKDGKIDFRRAPLSVELVPSRKAHRDCAHMPPDLGMMQEVMVLNGGAFLAPKPVHCPPAAAKGCRADEDSVVIPYTIREEDGYSVLYAIWPGRMQFAEGEYDLVVYCNKDGFGQGCADWPRAVCLVAHSMQADMSGNTNVEASIEMGVLLLQVNPATEGVSGGGSDLSEIEGKIEGLEGKIEGLEGKVESLEGEIEALSGRLDALEGGDKPGPTPGTVTTFYYGNNADEELTALPADASQTTEMTFEITGNGVNKTVWFAVPAGTAVSVTESGLPSSYDKAADTIDIDGTAYDLYYSKAKNPWPADYVATITVQ